MILHIVRLSIIGIRLRIQTRSIKHCVIIKSACIAFVNFLQQNSNIEKKTVISTVPFVIDEYTMKGNEAQKNALFSA